MLALFLCADGFIFSGEATVQSFFNTQNSKKAKESLYLGITDTYFNIWASKITNTWELGYRAAINPTLFVLGYVFENNYFFMKKKGFGELRAGNLYGPDAELCTPAQKLMGFDFIDNFYNNSAGFFNGRALGSSGIAAKGVYYLPTLGNKKHRLRLGVSYAPDTTQNGFRFNTSEKLNYKASLPTSNYANIWFNDKVYPYGTHHVTLASQYRGRWSQVNVEAGAAYLFGKAKVHDLKTEKDYDLNNKHSLMLSLAMAFKQLELAVEFVNNGKGALPEQDIKDLTLKNASKGMSGKSVHAALRLHMTRQLFISAGHQLTWNYLTDENDSTRRAYVGAVGYRMNDRYTIFVKGGYIESTLDKEAVKTISAFSKKDIERDNSSVFIGAGMTARF